MWMPANSGWVRSRAESTETRGIGSPDPTQKSIVGSVNYVLFGGNDGDSNQFGSAANECSLGATTGCVIRQRSLAS